MNDKLSPEQLREKLVEIEKSIDTGHYVDAHRVYKKRIALLVMGEYMPQYDKLSDEDKQKVDFDVDGLVKKVNDWLG